MSENSRYRPDIQGLRAISVAGVVVFHATSGRWLPGGFVGVDVFFVISGFLITGLLLPSPGGERPSLVGFYRRRALRLVPALCAMLAFVLIVGALLLPVADYAATARMAMASLSFCSNILLSRAGSYFDPSADLRPLQHTWSLGVEEQFYLLFPIVFAGLLHFAARRKVLVVSLVALASLAASCLLVVFHPVHAFYALPSRGFELLIGALLALRPAVLQAVGPRGRGLISCAGLVAIGASFAFILPTTPFPGAMALIPCLGAAAVIAAGVGAPSFGGRLISSSPFVFIGAISYSLYLWHWPLLVFARYRALAPLDLPTAALVLVVSVAIAWASWRWIEQPALRAGRPRRLAPVLLAAGVVLAASAAVAVAQGAPQRFSPEARAMFDARQNYNPRRLRCHAGARGPVAYDQSCIFGVGAPSVAIFGDSQGAELAVVLGDALAAHETAVLQLTASACPPAVNYVVPRQRYCAPRNTAILEDLAADDRITHVVLTALYFHRAGDDAFLNGMASTIDRLRRAGKQVILVGPIPAMPFDPPTAVGMHLVRGHDPSTTGMSVAQYGRLNATFVQALPELARRSGSTYLDPFPILCRPDLCPAWRSDAGVLYFDDIHMSLSGARLLVPALMEQLYPADPSVKPDPVAA